MELPVLDETVITAVGVLAMELCRGVLCLLVLVLLSFSSRISADELILAGGDEVVIVDAGEAVAGRLNRLWRWSGQEAVDIPAEVRKQFHHLDECKVVEGGRRVLVCASNGGCALLERAGGKVIWRATSRNAHSLDLLPRERVVVASSLSGDHLEIFDLQGTAVPVYRTPLKSAHGVFWDQQLECLWALGFDELRCYELQDWATAVPQLKLQSTWRLPDPDGHDLRAVPGTSELLVTTEHNVFLFDRDSHDFRPYKLLQDEGKIKSVDVHPVSGWVVVGRWTERVQLLNPAGELVFGDIRPYKARWVTSGSTDH